MRCHRQKSVKKPSQYGATFAKAGLQPPGKGDDGKKIQTGLAMITHATDFLIRRSFAAVMIACGLGLTVAWISLFGYGLIKLLEFAV